MRNFSGLRKLVLEDKSWIEPVFLKSIGSISTLTELTLSQNSIQNHPSNSLGKDISVFPQLLLLKELTHLNLSETRHRFEKCDGEVISGLSGLISLDISRNVSNENFINELTKLPKLECLTMSIYDQNFNIQIFKEFPCLKKITIKNEESEGFFNNVLIDDLIEVFEGTNVKVDLVEYND